MLDKAKQILHEMRHANWTGTLGDAKWKTELMSIATMMGDHCQTLFTKGKVMSADNCYYRAHQEHVKEKENKKCNRNTKDCTIAKICHCKSTKSNDSNCCNAIQSHSKVSLPNAAVGPQTHSLVTEKILLLAHLTKMLIQCYLKARLKITMPLQKKIMLMDWFLSKMI